MNDTTKDHAEHIATETFDTDGCAECRDDAAIGNEHALRVLTGAEPRRETVDFSSTDAQIVVAQYGGGGWFLSIDLDRVGEDRSSRLAAAMAVRDAAEHAIGLIEGERHNDQLSAAELHVMADDSGLSRDDVRRLLPHMTDEQFEGFWTGTETLMLEDLIEVVDSLGVDLPRGLARLSVVRRAGRG